MVVYHLISDNEQSYYSGKGSYQKAMHSFREWSVVDKNIRLYRKVENKAQTHIEDELIESKGDTPLLL